MKRNRLFLIILALLSAFVPRIWAQEQPTVSTDLEVLIPYETMQGQGATGIELMPASFYKFNYETVDASGNPIVLSSALIAPRDVTQTIGAVYMDCHYTITNNLEAPTSWTLPMFDLATGFSTALARYLAVPYYEDQGNSNAPYGLIIAPDYEGFGVSIERPQSYLAQELTARQVVDAMAKGMELYRKLIVAGTAPRLDNDWHSYAFGLSQGGAVALAVQRYIEQNDLSDQFNYNGTLCVEGPYDLITTLKYYLEDNGSSYDVSTAHRAGQTTMPVVIPMIIQGMLVSDPSLSSCQLSDFLSQKFLDTGIMDWLAAKNMTTDDIKAAWNNQRQNGFTANGRTYTPEDMATLFTSNMYANLNEVFTSDFFAYLSTAGIFDNVPDVPEANDPQRAYKLMHRAMAAQDLCTGWTPQHKIQFWHSKKDMVVPFGNYLAFQEAQPSGENSIYRLKDISDEGDHLDACSSFFYDAFNEYNTTFEWILWEGQYWEGDGNSWETAYLIRNCRELDTLAARVNRGNGYSGKYFKLMNDLVYDYTGLGETETNYTPIGFYDDDIHNYFRGHFDGGNHTISGLRIYGVTIGQGLFGVVMEAEVKNVILDDAIIAGSHCAGGIIGLSYYGTADNCHVTSSVTIRNIPDRSQYHHGGIVGQNQRGTIKYCISEATIIGYPNGKYFGGILGGNYTEGGNLYNNFAIGVTVPASKDNTTHGAILGQKNISELTNNYYFNCTVADEENTVTKGCENANVAENDGAVPVFSLTIPEGFGAEGIATITYNTVDYYKSGTTITLIAPDDRTYTYYVNDEPIEGNSFTMTANTVVTAFFDWAVNYEGTADDPYLIWSTEDWDLLCTRVNDLSVPNTYEGSYFKLMDDISVNTMVGHTLMGAFETKFKGTFDGGGKTLTFTYTSNNTNEQFIAPFRIIEGATIKNLKVAGTIDTKSRFAGGVVANARGAGNVITNCMSSITINATNTNDYSGYHGGILGQLSGSGGNVTLSGCVFNGKMLGTHVQGWSGILGNIINGGTFTISNCLFYPEEINIRNTEYNSNYTICFGGDDAPNCYYNEVGAEMSYVQGKEAKSIIAGENIDAVAFAGDATEYTASGLTAYANNHGMLYCDGTNCTLIAGYNDNVSLNLTVPSGFVITDATYAYEGGSETITPVDGVYSFTMPYADVTINAEMVCGIVIHAYTENSEDHYYLIASPIGDVNPEVVSSMLANNYDLYYFDQSQELEWINYKGANGNYNLEAGKGYLYANSEDVTLIFTGEPYTGSGEVTLSKTTGAEWEGWNLVGNPFAETAYIADGRPFYTMNPTGSEIIATTSNSIEAMEGLFVIANYDGETMTFTTEQPANNDKSLTLNLFKGRGVIDRAIISFGEGRTLPKFQINRNSTKVYIHRDNKDYAVINAEAQGKLPVSFKAEENGTYTLSLSSDKVSFGYLHLIDNLTGADVDLLVNPSYTFEAKNTDYASRFKLVFVCGDANGDNDFAFISNGDIIVNGEGTLQVIDVMGRIVLSGDAINRVSTSGMTPGVYVLRLINGDDVKTQKIVVR